MPYVRNDSSLETTTPAGKRRRVVVTVPGPGCAAVAEDLGLHRPRFISVLYAGETLVERRFSDDDAVAARHAHAMLDEHLRRMRGAA